MGLLDVLTFSPAKEIAGSTIFGKKAPKVAEGASDPARLVQQEQLLNRPNILSAFGGRKVSTDPSGRTQIELQESPFQQKLRGLQEQRALNLFGGDDFGREATTEALFEQGQTLLAPGRERERRRLETELSQKGLPIGSEAFAGAQGRQRTFEGQQDRALALQSILAGGAESRAERGQQLAEVSPVLSGQQFLQNLTDVQPVNVSGIFQQADQQKLLRNQLENERRKARFEAISGAVATAFAPTPTGGA
jgi:hypothetical protein